MRQQQNKENEGVERFLERFGHLSTEAIAEAMRNEQKLERAWEKSKTRH